ncbi:MAG: Glycosyl transferase, family 2 [Candidatus Woesebacteria bacterium GW2011_GWB1_43_14]|uniref:Glycosyl transferase, family 2 n=1 Tax=Candidatus Woesebacteria bacterium GW2011_GWB1_43_14 TaxID=1618578 RepID=A0A0G1FQF1_9BACT|nr:MAG: Glycosyl transferase, family 2 [Candidatus Woesebacteria bacterium GW2011_GWA1_39_11b]KKS78326.1 MAG: Glycosyl transferase, family 2 [Candidatus Woesebacteria bacterium GW2011_GWC1_42_9]KKS97256.1 MAG: Glycosyl transferase, family 2 [Candidatus Woesebacteria bacterium GW2011_GWB1_43_14]
MRVSIVIPSWNSESLLRRNLPKVLEAKKIKSNRINEIIIVDDASQDKTVTFLAKEYRDKIRLFRHRTNRGFASTVNMGARMARSSLICLLNTDVIPEKDFLKKVIPHFKNNQVFAVGLHEKGFGPAKGGYENGYIKHSPLEENDEVQHTFWVSGGSGVFRRKVWLELGGMDDRLLRPFYWEDVDLGYRAQKRAYFMLWEPGAMVVHKHESIINETNFKKKYLEIVKERNQLLVIWKNITSRSMFRKHLEAMFQRTVSSPGYLRVILAALLRLIVVRQGRKREIKQSIVSDESVFSRFK